MNERISINGKLYTAEELAAIMMEYEAKKQEELCPFEAVSGIMDTAWELFFKLSEEGRLLDARIMMENTLELLGLTEEGLEEE